MTTSTEYVPVQPVQQERSGPGFFSRQTQNVRSFAANHSASSSITVPAGLPSFLASRRTIVYMWAASMAIISWDEWHNNHILPRPSRLWYATAFYLMLAIASAVSFLGAIANALAIGYTIMLAWEYFNGSGQFASGGES